MMDKLPIKKEEVKVSEKLRVKKDVAIKKKPVTEIRQVSKYKTTEGINTFNLELGLGNILYAHLPFLKTLVYFTLLRSDRAAE